MPPRIAVPKFPQKISSLIIIAYGGESYYEVSQYLLVNPIDFLGCTAVVGVERTGAWVLEPGR